MILKGARDLLKDVFEGAIDVVQDVGNGGEISEGRGGNVQSRTPRQAS